MQPLSIHTIRQLGLRTIAALFLMFGGPLAAVPQEPGWLPSRPGDDGQRLRDQVAARRPGMQAKSTAPTATAPDHAETVDVADAGVDAGVVEAGFSQPPPLEFIFDDSQVGSIESDEVVLGDVEVIGDGHSFCDCPQCMAGVAGLGRNSLYNLLGELNGCGWWVTADYLLWSFDGVDLPALVTTSPNGTSPATTGILGLNSTSTLLGGTVADDFRSGGRIKIGMWLDPARQYAWEVSYFGFDSDSQTPTFSSANTPNLARPVFDTLTGSETTVLVSHSDFLSGGTAIDVSTELQSFEVVRRQNWRNDGVFNVDLLLGYKHGDLDEFLRIDDSSVYEAAQGPILAGTAISRFDQFDIENSFDGFLIGLDRRHVWRGWLIGYTGKVSLGANQARVRIDGRTTTTVPSGGGTAIANGGLLAQSSNIGDFRRDQFAVIPEFEILVRRQVTDRVRLHAGYSLLYWSAATRLGDTLSRRVSQLPPEPVSGTREPSFVWTDGGFFAQGFQFGLDYKF